MANREIGEHLNRRTAGDPRSRTSTLVGTRKGHREAGDRTQRQPRAAPTSNLKPRTESRPGPTTAALAHADEQQRLVRDLLNGLQNELFALMLRLERAEEDRTTPSAFAATLASLEDHTAAALASLREIACDTYPLALTRLGLSQALRALAARAPLKMCVAGTAPRTTNEAEATMYFCCLEAVQNAAKHGGRSAQVKLGLRHDDGMLAARIADDGRGFDPAYTRDGAGLRTIRERVQTLNGTLRLTSTPGHGTVMTVTLPWPAAAEGQR